MAEAKLRIIATVAGDGRQQLVGMRENLDGFNRDQEKALSRTTHLARGAGTALAGMGRSLFSLRTAIIGIATSTAGASILDMTIGSADRINQSRNLLQMVLRDTEKVRMAEQKARDLVAEIPSLDQSGAMDAMAKLSLLGDNNVETTGELVRTMAALAGTMPGKTIDDAKRALQELASGDTMSLREQFNIKLPTGDEAKKAAAKAKKTLKQYYIDELHKTLSDTYEGGVTGMLELQNKSIGGQLLQLRTSISNSLADIGENAARDLVPALREVNTAIGEAMKSEDFRTLVKDFGSGLRDAAIGAAELAREMPGIIQQTHEFLSANKELIALAAGGYAANNMTDGALGRGLLAGAQRVLFGRKGGAGMAQTLGADAAGATPVYVVNMGDMRLPTGDSPDMPLREIAKKAGQGGNMTALARSMTMSGALSQGGLAGVAGQFGAGTAAGMMAIPAAFIGAGLALKHSSELTVRNLRIADSLGRSTGMDAANRDAAIAMANRRAMQGGVAAVRVDPIGLRVRKNIDSALLARDSSDRSRNLRDTVLNATTALQSGGSEAASLLDSQLAGLGLDVQMKNGRAKFSADAALIEQLRAAEASGDSATAGALSRKLQDGAELAKELNKIKIDKQEIHLHITSSGNPNQDEYRRYGEMVASAISVEMMKIE